MSSACTGVTSNAFVSANRDVGPGSACSSQSTATPPPATPISYEGRVSLLAPNHAAHFGGVPRRAIKVECDMLDLNGHGVHHAANLDAALPLYQSFSPPFAALGNSSAILTPPATHADAAERKSTPPLNWTPTTPTRISTVDSLAAGGVRGHSINDSGISPGHAVSDCPTDGSDGKSAKRDSVSSGDDLGHQMAPSASPSFSNDDEDDDMTNEMDEEDDDDDVDEEEDDEQDAVGDALSRLQRALEAGRTQNGQTDVYQCHLCSYSGTSRFHFQAHLNTHFDVKCTHCDFTARTEGKLRAHMRNAHGVQTDAGKEGRATRVNPSGKAKSFKCKQCQFVAVSKMSYWEHSRSHIKAEKLLTCPKCPFVTEYKHHLEYHMRNHFGSKPFKCPKCSYSCVNKSMLNSHMKSHSNVYQYRCADCAYATKYCHSLKLHLRKYGHTPTVELHDTEEGPAADRKRSRKRQSKTRTSDKSKPVKDPMPKATTPLKETPGVTTNSTVGYGLPLARMAGHHPPTDGSDVKKPRVEDVERRKCDLCDFTCADKNELSRHLVVHAAAENRDLANLFGVESNAPACSSSPLGHKMATDMPQVKDYLRMLANPLLFGAGFPGAAPLLASRNPIRDLDCIDSDSNRTMTPEATPKRPSAAPLDLSRDKDDPSALPSTGQSNKHRRKGQAFKLERPPARQSPPLSSHSLTPSPPPVPEEKSGDQSATFSGAYQCNYCDIAFKDVVMYTMHMGYHGYQDPFTCNMCGQQTNDKLSFFLHIARSSHV